MEFAILVFGGIAAVLIGIMLASRYSSKSASEILDWKPTRSFEQEVELEADDVDQMIAVRNARRRRRGEVEVSEDDFREEVFSEEQAQRARAARYRAEDGGESPR